MNHRGIDPGRAEGQTLAWRLRRPAVPLAKAALRGAGMATAGRRPGPDFLIIGAKRGGSTSLYRNLLATPGFVPLFPRPADIKGTYYFDVEFARGERWYRSHFPTRSARRETVAGEASPYYLSHPWAAERAADLVPDAAVIAVLRDPVARAHSHYRERVRQGIEGLPTFAEAIAAEDRRLAGEVERMRADPAHVSWNHLNFGYVAQSEYAPNLARWRDAFGPDSVLVLRSEDLYVDTPTAVDSVRSHLGLDPVGAAVPTRHYNDTGSPALDPGLERDLRDRLAPSVKRLEVDLGRSFDWPQEP